MGISLLSNNPVVVTGGAGFVGSHLVETLLEQGDTVRVFDQVPLSRARNLDATKSHPGFQYFEGDIRDSDALRTCIDGDVKTIFHLASTVGVERYIENPLDLIDVVVGGTRKLIENRPHPRDKSHSGQHQRDIRPQSRDPLVGGRRQGSRSDVGGPLEL